MVVCAVKHYILLLTWKPFFLHCPWPHYAHAKNNIIMSFALSVTSPKVWHLVMHL